MNGGAGVNEELLKKREKLSDIIKSYGTVAVAFSGGVDSTFLLAFANKVITGNVTAVTIDSHLAPEREIEEAERFCRDENIARIVIE